MSLTGRLGSSGSYARVSHGPRSQCQAQPQGSASRRRGRGTSIYDVHPVVRQRKIDGQLDGGRQATGSLRPISNDLRPRRLGDAHVRRAEEAEAAVAEAADDRGCVDKSVARPAPCAALVTYARGGPFGLWARPRSCSPTTRRRPGRTGRGKGTCFFGRGVDIGTPGTDWR